MARLPTVGGDSGNWGTVLNEYLGTAHNADGTLKLDVKTIADLKAIDVTTLTDKQQALVAGYTTPGDGGGGIFYYDAASSTADNGGTIFAPTVGAGRWIRNRAVPTELHVAWFSTLNAAVTAANALAATEPITLVFGTGDFTWPAGVKMARFLGLRGPGAFHLIAAPYGDNPTGEAGGCRITNVVERDSAAGQHAETTIEGIAFLSGLILTQQVSRVRNCWIGGAGLTIDASSRAPYYSTVEDCILRPSNGSTAFSIIGTAANAVFARGLSIFIPSGGRGLYIAASCVGNHVEASFDMPVGTPSIGSFVYIEGTYNTVRMMYSEERAATCSDGAKIVFTAASYSNTVHSGSPFQDTVLDSSTAGNGNLVVPILPRQKYRNTATVTIDQSSAEFVHLGSSVTAVNLPSIASWRGKMLVLKTSGIGTITLTPSGSETINWMPSTTPKIDVAYSTVTLTNDGGTNWSVDLTDSVYYLAANSATPRVAGVRSVKTQNSSPTTITNFQQGFDGQEITLLIRDSNTTLDFTGNANFSRIDGVTADWAAPSGGIAKAYFNGTAWLFDLIKAA